MVWFLIIFSFIRRNYYLYKYLGSIFFYLLILVVILYKQYRLTINTITRAIVNDEKIYIFSKIFN